MPSSQKLQPLTGTSKRREDRFHLPLPASQVFQRGENWPFRATREDPKVVNEVQYVLARICRRVYRNSRYVIMYANDRMIPGTVSEWMDSKFAWYEYEMINNFQRTFDDFGRDN
ncbi:hypothetical protein O181_078883 [Austropuccinia psidii MF-1]|uniref:Uncharacterized protein n=1 Tax=Austropuccinia psidii MF-1 TaxID=1389203 RepID=A0A9Q3IF24_9BASI|nr:hypothetical protein [Austropuccinia psidii MF-1]